MNLDRVTITGADDSVSTGELVTLSESFPFVEWGILVSASHGSAFDPRFPCHEWIRDLQSASAGMNLSLHVCGQWVRELLVGKLSIPDWMTQRFQRIQLNFHAERTECRADKFFDQLYSLSRMTPRRQWIFQIDGAKGNAHLEALYGENDGEHFVDAVPLFDISGGAGILPSEWPKPEYMSTDVDHCYHGYAGGLGPDNLEQQLPLIAKAAGETRIWIDMETRVRSDNDRTFDLDKVRRCLEISAPHIRQKVTA